MFVLQEWLPSFIHISSNSVVIHVIPWAKRQPQGLLEHITAILMNFPVPRTRLHSNNSLLDPYMTFILSVIPIPVNKSTFRYGNSICCLWVQV